MDATIDKQEERADTLLKNSKTNLLLRKQVGETIINNKAYENSTPPYSNNKKHENKQDAKHSKNKKKNKS